MKLVTHREELEVILDIEHYSNNNNIAIQLYDAEDGEPYATITTNIIPLPEGCVALDTNNCPWAEEFLESLGVLEDALGEIQSGFCEYPVYQLDLDKLYEVSNTNANA